MRLMVIALMMGSILVGCSTRTAQVDGYASPRTEEERLRPVSPTGTAEDPGKERSVRDFSTPKGLY